MPLRSEIREADLLVYGRACPNCGGFISDTRLKLGVPCTSCLKTRPKDTSIDGIYNELRRAGRLQGFHILYSIRKKYEEMVDFFKKCVGNEPWSIQKLWLKRIAKEASFAMIAPTGIGKTTFGIAVALYLALKGYKTYIIVPTTTLAIQLEKRIEEMSSRAGVIVRPLVIHSRLRKKEKEVRESQLDDPEGFDILVTTSNYLLRNADRIIKHDFKLIFVDDVDAILRGSKAINYILYMAGFNDDDIEKGLKIIKLKRELAYRGEDPELLNRISRLEESLERKRRKLGKIVIIASATGNPRGTRVKLFKELMGFEIGARPEFIRNITDCYLKPKGDLVDEVIKLVKMLGNGGLVYVPIDAGREYAEQVAEALRKAGIAAEAMHSKNIKAIDAFVAGELSVLVGVATYYGVLVRGIDLPEIIRYAIFVGVPRHKIGLRLKEVKPQDVLRLLPLVRDALDDDKLKRKIDSYIARIRRTLRRLGSFALQRIDEVLKGKREPESTFEREFLEALNLLKELTKKEEVLNAIKQNPEVAVIEEGELYVLIPDAPTYIQASGRTSRLYLGGISKGLSVVIVDDERLLKGLERKLKWIIEDFSFVPLENADLKKVVEEIDSDRSMIRALKEGKVPKEMLTRKGKMLELKTALLIVESPNKARTIARFFGRPSVREYGRLRVYEVNLGNYTLLITASGGHIYDLITDVTDIPNIYGVAYLSKGGEISFIPIYTTLKRCLDKGHQFTVELHEGTPKCPVCGSSNIFDAKVTIDAIRDVALEVDEVLVGTDPDTEGEKIAFDIVNTVLPVNNNVKRIEFHEVTKRAIINAVNNPREVDLNLVRAQLVRRIEDRWLGFSLSRLLQTEFWQKFCKEIMPAPSYKENIKWYLGLCTENPLEYRNLSAGRVQTPVLGWIIQAYEDHIRSKRLYIIVDIDGIRLDIPVPEELRKELRLGPKSIAEVQVSILEVKEEVSELNPPPP
ncbi:MAG: reverse gyrase, partial [Desulfurococcales archaeon]|nr:reverse gyrase [Desulfurococcales archaeon]